MKKILYLILLLFLVEMELNAQPAAGPAASPDWRVGGNTAVNNLNVIGPWWNPGGGAVASQMWFTTGAAAPQYRMTIFGGALGVNDGQIAMGNNLPAAFVPSARLHLHQTGGNNFTRYSTNTTGAGAQDGFVIGITDPGFTFLTNFEPSQPTTFFTNDGTANGTFERIRVNAFNVNGFVGMGNSANFTAQSQLHINTIGANISAIAVGGEVFRTDGASTVDNNWRMWTGTTIANSTQKGRIFTSNTGTAHVHPINENFNLEATRADMVFWANGTRPLGTTPLVERMRITSELFGTGAGAVDVTRVGISRDAGSIVADPRSMLHIGQAWPGAGTGGHRTWMDVGTYYNLTSDMLYVGQQNVANDRNDAVFAWGDNPANFGVNGGIGDRLYFRFMNTPALGTNASGPDGLEMARMVSDGNNGRMSIGNPAGGPFDPGNTLEIISSALSPQPAGLRFRNLTCTSPVVQPCNPANPVVLSVDNNGDVILINGATGSNCCLGNACGTAPNPLTGSWEIPMNTFNFAFTDPIGPLNDGQNFVGIGTSCSPRAKLDVFRTFTNNALPIVIGAWIENQDIATSVPNTNIAYGTYSVSNNQNKGNYGVVGEAMKGGANIGVMGQVNDPYFGGSNALQNSGVQGVTSEGLTNTGVYGSAVTSNPLTVNNTGGLFSVSAFNNTNSINGNVGVHSTAVNNGGTTVVDNIGVLSYAINTGNTTNNVGVAGISQNFGGTVNDIGLYGEGALAAYFAGPTFTGPVIVFSDKNIKTDVQPLQNSTAILKKLNPVTYNYKTTEYPELHMENKLQYGFIAQEVEQVIPELVSEGKKPEFKDKEGKIISKGGEYKGINYDGLIPVLTKSMQEQISEVEALKKEVAELKEIIRASGNYQQSTGTNHVSNIELTDAKSIVLDQNVPNPFAEQTVITYTLTDDVQKAQLLFYNADGKLINSMELNERGKGQVNVFANDLSNGVYTYTLVVDGRIIDSKRMIRNK